jgi:hypothetical protein
MKKFLLVIGINLIILLLILEVTASWLLSTYNYFSKKHEWNWLTLYQKDIEKNLESDTLVLGCSVAHQIYPFGAIKNYKTTTAIDLMVTSYIYIAKAIESTPRLKTVVIVTIPYGFCQRFENIYSYNIFVKPYYRFSNFKYFDSYLHRKVSQRPFALLNAFALFKILPISDFNYDDGQSISYDSLSDYSIRYLGKLKALTDSHNIDLVFLASPVSETFMRYTQNLIPLKESIRRNGFADLFPFYFDNLIVYPDSCFKDGTHFKADFLENHRVEIIRKLNLAIPPNL